VRLSRDLLLYLVSRTASGAGLTMMRAAVGWHLYELTRSPFMLGLVGLVQLVPAVGLALPAGVVVDRYERRRVIQIGQTLALLAMMAPALLALAGHTSVAVLFSAVSIVSGVGAFTNPARSALLPQLVDREHFPRAVTLASSSQALAFALGPALAGLVISQLSISAAYVGAAFMVGLSVLSLMFLQARPPAEHKGAISLHAMLEGLRFVRNSPVLLGTMTLDLFAVILGGAGALLPIFANDVLKVGAEGYGILSGALEAGALSVALLLLFLPPIERIGPALFAAVTVYGFATFVFGVSTSFSLSLVAYAVAGMADQVSVVLRQTTLQLQTPDTLRGRVSSVSMIFINLSNQLAAVEAGFVAGLVSAPFAVMTGGAGVLVVVVIVAIAAPSLRAYRLTPRAHSAS
jgi:MFS family permease